MTKKTDTSHDVAYVPVPEWCRLSGMGRTATYHELSRGNLRAVKLGKRTLVDVRHGLAWMGNLPPATIKLAGFSPTKAAA